VDYLVRSAADLPAYRYFVEHTRYEPNYEFARNRTAQIGEAGVVLVYTPRTPFMRLLAIDAGLENMMTIMMEDPDGFDDTIALMRRRFTDAAALAAACPADIVMIPENLSAEMVGPRLFRRYMQDCQVQWSEMIKRNGKHSCIHMDGTLRGLLREEASIGLTFIEACTPEPVGDVPVRDWPSYIRGTNTCLWGGIPGAYFTEQVDDEEFDRHVVETLSVMRREPRYVLGVADQVPPDGLERRMRRVRELVDIHGNYE
jgi:uroporphyrinogen-III decarboxylase